MGKISINWLVSYIYKSNIFETMVTVKSVSPLDLFQLANLADFFILPDLEAAAIKTRSSIIRAHVHLRVSIYVISAMGKSS